MSGNESSGGRPRPVEPKIVIPSLIPPYDGVFDEVLGEYASDPSSFFIALEHRMTTDNPNLISYIDPRRPMQEGLLSIKWSAIYYEMFARSAKKAGGVPMPVTDAVLDEYHGTRIRKSAFLRAASMEETSIQFEEDLQRRKVRRARDEALSPELKKFWEMVDLDTVLQISKGAPRHIGEIYILGVQALQAVLQNQHDAYAGPPGQIVH